MIACSTSLGSTEIDPPAMDRTIMMKTHMAEAFMLPYTLLSGTSRRGYGYGNDNLFDHTLYIADIVGCGAHF